jgi:hypothetical protein
MLMPQGYYVPPTRKHSKTVHQVISQYPSYSVRVRIPYNNLVSLEFITNHHHDMHAITLRAHSAPEWPVFGIININK